VTGLELLVGTGLGAGADVAVFLDNPADYLYRREPWDATMTSSFEVRHVDGDTVDARTEIITKAAMASERASKAHLYQYRPDVAPARNDRAGCHTNGDVIGGCAQRLAPQRRRD